MEKGRIIFSAALASVILTVLFLSGPASAVILKVVSTSSISENSITTLVGAVDFQENERVPIEELTLEVRGVDNNYERSCTFKPNGEKLDCDDVFGQLSVNNAYNYKEDTELFGYGYGYGYTPTLATGMQNTSFGYGYGYGYAYGYGYDALPYGELSYSLRWLTPSVSADRNYEVNLYAKATGSNGNEFYYETREDKKSVIEVTAYSSGGGGSSDEEEEESLVKEEETATYSNIVSGQGIALWVNNDDIAASYVVATMQDDKESVTLSVASLNRQPENISGATEKVYQYLDINAGDAPVSRADVDFRVDRDWIRENDMSVEDVKLFHYNGQWEQLETELLGYDNQYANYKATSGSFSYFAIGEKTEEVQVQEPVEEPVQEQEPQQDTTEDSDSDEIVQQPGKDEKEQKEPQDKEQEEKKQPTDEPEKQQEKETHEEKPAKKDKKEDDSNSVWWIAAVLGLVILVGGGIFAFLALKPEGQINNAPQPPNMGPPQQNSMNNPPNQ